MPELDVAVFLGEGDLKHFFCFSGASVSASVFASKLVNEKPKKDFQKEPRRVGSVFFPRTL